MNKHKFVPLPNGGTGGTLSGMRRPTGRAGIAFVSLKRRRSTARNDAADPICLSSNRRDRRNQQ